MIVSKLKPSEYYLLGFYALILYLSSQLHEIGHWLTAALLGLEFALGFNRWQIVSDTDTGRKLAVLIAGPAVTLALIIMGFLMYFYVRNLALKRAGLLFVISNSLMLLIYNLLSLLTGGRGDIGWVAFYLGLPGYALKLPLAAISGVAVVAGFRWLEPEVKNRRWVLEMLTVFVVVMGLIVVLDMLVWRSYEQSMLLFPIWGISAVTLITNSFVLAIFTAILWKVNTAYPG